jgi:hypothetical protein
MLRFHITTVQDRSFPSYGDCPGIYYRFNGKGEYGPEKLDRFVSFFAARSNEMIEGRFADEDLWRPLRYFLNLWDCIPPSAHTIKRLKRAGVNPEGTTESAGRKLLRDKQNSKPPTVRQIEYLRAAGILMLQLENQLRPNQQSDAHHLGQSDCITRRPADRQYPFREDARSRLRGVTPVAFALAD